MQGKAAPRKALSRWRVALLRFILVLSIFVGLLGMLELVLRSTHLFGARLSCAQADPVIGWRFIPNGTYWHYLENDHPITGKINSHGWRDRERSLAKPDGSFRIAVLGDSYVEALQVEQDSTFLSIAERFFDANFHRKVEVLNFGRSGATQTEEMVILENDVVKYEPDVVVLFFLPGNDISDMHPRTTTNRLRPFYRVTEDSNLVLDTSFTRKRGYKLRKFISPFKRRSILVSLLAERLNALQRAERGLGARDEANRPNKIVGSLTLCTANPDPDYSESYRLNKLLFVKMAEFCQANDIVFLLVCINLIYRPEFQQEFKAMDPTFNPAFYSDDLADFARAHDIEYLGLQRPFQTHYERTGESLTWGHWNYAGHRVVAAELVGKLTPMLERLAESR